MSDVQWYILVAPGKKVGPASFERICELAAQGKIKPTTRIRDDAGGQWIPAAEVPGVFKASGDSPATPPETAEKSPENDGTSETAVPESLETMADDLELGVEGATVVAVETPKINPFAVRKEGRESGGKARETKFRDKTSGGGFVLFTSRNKGKNKGKDKDRKDDDADRDLSSDDTREGGRTVSKAEETVATSSDTVVINAADTEAAIRGAVASVESPVPVDSPKSASSRDRFSASRGRSTAAGSDAGHYKGMETVLKLATPAMILGVTVSLAGAVAGIIMACLAGNLLVAIGCVFSALFLVFQAFVFWLAWTFFRDWVRLTFDVEENIREIVRLLGDRQNRQ